MQSTLCDMSLTKGGGGGGQGSTNCHYNILSLPEGRGRGVEEVGPMSLYMDFFCGWHPLIIVNSTDMKTTC